MPQSHLAAVFVLAAGPALAGAADILEATAVRGSDGWRVTATVRHADTGWEHYADAFRVIGPDGTVYGTRTLHHPHVEEQPFTRALGGLAIPADVPSVTVEARDSLHGWGGATVEVRLAD